MSDDKYLYIISTLIDDIGHFGIPRDNRCRSLNDIIDLMLDKSLPIWLRDTCCFTLTRLASNDHLPEAHAALEKVKDEPNNVGKIAQGYFRFMAFINRPGGL